MFDPADVNADSAATSGAINVFSPHGLTVMFHGMVSVTEGLLPARTLVDTGASHCYVLQACVDQAGIPVRPSQNWLKLADNTQAVSNGTCTLALDLETYSGPIECFVLPLSDQFDLILGDDWCNETGCEISYCDHCLRCNDHDGRRHNLIIQSDQHQVHCLVISAVNLNTEMEEPKHFVGNTHKFLRR